MQLLRKVTISSLVAALLFLNLGISTAFAGKRIKKWKIYDVSTKQMNANNFKRISEFFTGEENTGYRTVVRSNPSNRDGFYFVLQFNRKLKHLPKYSTITIDYIREDKPEPMQNTVIVPDHTNNSGVLYFGLTNNEWPVGVKPVAWNITVKDPEGNVLANKSSYLWSIEATD